MTIDMDGKPMGYDASKEFTIIITNILSFVGCSIMKFMVIAWFNKLKKLNNTEEAMQLSLTRSKLDGEAHGVVTPLDVEVRGASKNLEQFEMKLKSMMLSRCDCHNNASSSNSNASSRECSVTRSQTADHVNIISVIPSKEDHASDSNTSTTTKEGGHSKACSFRDGYARDNEDSLDTKSMNGSILMALGEE